MFTPGILRIFLKTTNFNVMLVVTKILKLFILLRKMRLQIRSQH